MADLVLAIRVTAEDDTGGTLGKINQSLRDAEKAAAKLGKGRRREGIGRTFREGAAAVERLGASAEGLVSGPLQSADRFESRIASIRTLIDDSQISTAQLEQITMDAAAAFGGDAPKQAEALYDIISAGSTDAASATELLEASNRFAIAGLTDTQTAALALTKSLANFQQEGLDATRASDVLFSAVKRGQTTVGELSRAFPKVASAAGGAGLTIEEAAGGFAELTKVAGSSGQAATQFTAAIGNILKPSKQAETAIAQLAKQGKQIDFGAEALRERGLVGFFSQFEGVSDETLVRIFGSKKGAEAARAFRDNITGVEQAVGDAANSAGAADEAFAKQAATGAQAAKRAEAAIENLRIVAGSQLAPAVAEAATELAPLVKQITAFVKENKGLVSGLGKVVLGVGVAGRVAGGLRTTVGLVSDTAKAFRLLSSPLASVTQAAVSAVAPGALPALTKAIGPGSGGLTFASLGAVAAVGGLAFALGSFIDDQLQLSDRLAGTLDEGTRGSPGFRDPNAVVGDLVGADGQIITDAAQRRRAAGNVRQRLIQQGVRDEAEQRIQLRRLGFTDADFRTGGGRQQQGGEAQINVKVGIDDAGRPTAAVSTGGSQPVNLQAGIGVAT